MPQPDVAAVHVAVEQTASTMGWCSARSRHATAAICAAAAAVVIETWHFLGDGSLGLRIGDIPVSPSLLPVLAVVALGGPRLVGRARSRDSAKVFWCMVTMVLAVVVAGIDGIDPATAAGLVMAALSEELVYRLAAPVLVAYGLARAGVRYRHALTVGYMVSGIAFVALPGHVAQWDHWSGAVPFVAFTALATLAVHRSGAVLAVAVLHAAMNMVNIGRMTGAVGTPGAVMLAGLLALLLIGYAAPTRRRPSEADIVVDLTGEDPVVTVDGAGRIDATDRSDDTPMRAEPRAPGSSHGNS